MQLEESGLLKGKKENKTCAFGSKTKENSRKETEE